ncbi:MAG TPA: hypothetical protein VKX96_13935 [Chloroflexota bacterium]|nr:hypothetical protein [Chloroflexota bacterium]
MTTKKVHGPRLSSTPPPSQIVNTAGKTDRAPRILSGEFASRINNAPRTSPEDL